MFAKMTRTFAFTLLLGAGCLGSSAPSGPAPDPGTGGGVDPGTIDPGTGGSSVLGVAPATSAGENGTFEHENDYADPFEVLSRISELGPPEVQARLHACQKMKFSSLGNLLSSLGVNVAGNGAGALYRNGGGAMGVPNYAARIAEALENTTAGATKMFDIFVQAAPQIITNMPNADACKVAGVGTEMFDAQGKCTLDGISCLQGSPATQAQKDLCDSALTAASTPEIGRTIAVATILAAAHLCE
jgi:hypothetical protein